MSFTLYLIGFIILILGLAWGANLMHIAPRWIGVGVVVMAGLGILSAVATTRRRLVFANSLRFHRYHSMSQLVSIANVEPALALVKSSIVCSYIDRIPLT